MYLSPRGLQMLVFSSKPGSASHDGLQLLSNWAAISESPQVPDRLRQSAGAKYDQP